MDSKNREEAIEQHLKSLPLDSLKNLKLQYEHDLIMAQYTDTDYDPQPMLNRINRELAIRKNVDL